MIVRLCFVLLFFCLNVSGQVSYIANMADGNTRKIWVFPANYKPDTTWKPIGKIKNGKKITPHFGEFDSQLEKLAEAVTAKGGNILVVSRIRDNKQSGRYKLSGNVFFTDHADLLDSIRNEVTNRTYATNAAYIVLYRPIYVKGHNDEESFYAVLNDSVQLLMKANTKYIIKVTNEGMIRLTAGDNGIGIPIEINARFGNVYYVRGYISYPYSGKLGMETKGIPFNGYNPYLLPTGNIQGMLESSMVSQITLKKDL